MDVSLLRAGAAPLWLLLSPQYLVQCLEHIRAYLWNESVQEEKRATLEERR